MAKSAKLAKFTVSPSGEEFKLHIEDTSGEVLELVATRDQIDLIDEALDALLVQGESADEVKA